MDLSWYIIVKCSIFLAGLVQKSCLGTYTSIYYFHKNNKAHACRQFRLLKLVDILLRAKHLVVIYYDANNCCYRSSTAMDCLLNCSV